MGTEGRDVVARNREEVQQRRNVMLRNLIVGSTALGEMKNPTVLLRRQK